MIHPSKVKGGLAIHLVHMHMGINQVTWRSKYWKVPCLAIPFQQKIVATVLKPLNYF
jgi:hypothetical protein